MDQTQLDRLILYIQSRYAVEPERLWAQYPDYMVFRHPASRKWFAIVMDVPKMKLGLPGEGSAVILDVKCDPRMTGSLLSQPGFLPAYHMSKNSWITILLDHSVPDDTMLPLLELSYDSVAPKQKSRT